MSNNENQRSKKLYRSFDLIEDEFIKEAEPHNEKPISTVRRALIKKVALIAACACIVIAIVPIINLLNKKSETDAPIAEQPTEEAEQIPVYDGAQYSASDIANFILSKGILSGTATTSYERVYVGQNEELKISPLPEEEYLTVYKPKEEQKALDQDELASFTDGILARWCERKNNYVPTYEIKEYTYSDSTKNRLDVFIPPLVKSEWEPHVNPMFSQLTYLNSAAFAFKSWPEEGPFLLGDAKVSMYDSTISDEQIIEELQPLKKELFYIFGVEFEDVTVSRYYTSGGTYPYSITVIFYNKSDDSSDYIDVTFSNPTSHKGTVLPWVTVGYRQFRDDTTEPVKKLKKISLAEAEELLYKGYVFGGHSCPICMANQTAVDFEGYDYVEIVYLSGEDEYNESIPFYAFYKYIGNNNSGNKVFARTYVPAIEISGYEEYFEAQKSNHKDPIDE